MIIHGSEDSGLSTKWAYQGKALFEKSASLVEPKFDEQGNYISKFQYNQPKIASYQDISYDYNKDGTVDIADQNLATKAGNTANADAIAASLSGTTPLPMSKLTEEEQMAGDLLRKDDYSNHLSKAFPDIPFTRK